MLHSNIVGGSTAKRVINCPGSVALVAKMPPKPSSEYADKGTLLHNAISEVLSGRPDVIGSKYNDQVLTQELFDDKINDCVKWAQSKTASCSGFRYGAPSMVMRPISSRIFSRSESVKSLIFLE